MGATLTQGTLFLSTMNSAGLAGRSETFVRYGVTPRFEAGFGYLDKQKTVRPLASYTLVAETRTAPSLTTGLMFDSLGGGRQGVFVSVAKDLQGVTGIPASLYLGGAKITNERGLRLLAGANFRLTPKVNASVQFDGRYANLGVTTEIGRVNGTSIRFGMVAAGGDKIGPLLATSFPVRAPAQH